MRRFIIALLVLSSLPVFAGEAVTGRIFKVLPFFLDQQGQDAKSPSLFDRDAYQVYLRAHTNEVYGVRYDVLWTAKRETYEQLKLRVELRGIGTGGLPKLKTMETSVSPGFFRKWTCFTLTGDEFKKLGRVVAWRATLWNGDQLLGEQQSFLW